ncbi:hypothetical protein K440DRAFT_618248 [Wilcoxina mikolae CBS 423.85]|nr:hypothetical protein K440DRAFT_618248 [Wilcoxina mikolae CBS 423.85]
MLASHRCFSPPLVDPPAKHLDTAERRYIEAYKPERQAFLNFTRAQGLPPPNWFIAVRSERCKRGARLIARTDELLLKASMTRAQWAKEGELYIMHSERLVLKTQSPVPLLLCYFSVYGMTGLQMAGSTMNGWEMDDQGLTIHGKPMQIAKFKTFAR